MSRRLLLAGVGVVLVAWLTLKYVASPEETFDPVVHISGKNVLVTGASSGIGREMALLFCEMGANVFVTARREKLLKQVIEECNFRDPRGGKHGYLPADMSNMAEAEKVVLDAEGVLGGLDYLLLNHARTNARVGSYRLNEDGLKDLKHSMDINFFSFIVMTAAAMPSLVKSQGMIAVTSSIAGELPSPIAAEYSASKFALNGFFSSLDLDLFAQNKNVSVTIAPLGTVDTDALQNLFHGLERDGKQKLKHRFETEWTIGRPRECAMEIIRGTALRRPFVYYPADYGVWSASIVWKLFPKFFRQSAKNMFGPEESD